MAKVTRDRLLVKKGKEKGLITAIAGSLTAGNIESVATLSPDYVGFRSAITTGPARGSEGVDLKRALKIREKVKTAQLPSRHKETGSYQNV